MYADLRVRESKKNKGKYEIIVYYENYSGEVRRKVICERDTLEEALELINKEF